jgi:rabenosyn-5
VSLEEEIEISLRTLEETLTQHSADQIGANNASFAEARQHSTALFADYEAIAKRLIAIPCPGGSGSSQDRIQRAITMHANLFLQKRVFLKVEFCSL